MQIEKWKINFRKDSYLTSLKIFYGQIVNQIFPKIIFIFFFFSEYDECSNPGEHGCEHECFNTLGGYSCQCRIGYELHSDEKRCESKFLIISWVFTWKIAIAKKGPKQLKLHQLQKSM